MVRSVFTGNRATDFSGAISMKDDTDASVSFVIITDTTFVNNSATAYGGAIDCTACKLLLRGKNIFTQNSCQVKTNIDDLVGGGAIYILSGKLYIEDTTCFSELDKEGLCILQHPLCKQVMT